jgi:hypothetical protein
MSRRTLVMLSVGTVLVVVISVVACGLGILLVPCQKREGYLSIDEPGEKVRAALRSAGIAASDVGASGYGVVCEDRLGRVHSYSLRESAIGLTVSVTDASNLDLVGDELLRSLQALDAVTAELRVERISFTDNTRARAVTPFTLVAAREAQSKSLRGAELVNFLERK